MYYFTEKSDYKHNTQVFKKSQNYVQIYGLILELFEFKTLLGSC